MPPEGHPRRRRETPPAVVTGPSSQAARHQRLQEIPTKRSFPAYAGVCYYKYRRAFPESILSPFLNRAKGKKMSEALKRSMMRHTQVDNVSSEEREKGEKKKSTGRHPPLCVCRCVQSRCARGALSADRGVEGISGRLALERAGGGGTALASSNGRRVSLALGLELAAVEVGDDLDVES